MHQTRKIQTYTKRRKIFGYYDAESRIIIIEGIGGIKFLFDNTQESVSENIGNFSN